MTAELQAELHGYGCAPLCPGCLARDLQAKAVAVREEAARVVEEMAESRNRSLRTKHALLAAAAAIRHSGKTE